MKSTCPLVDFFLWVSVLGVSFLGVSLLGVSLLGSVFLGVSSRGKTFFECPLLDFLSMSVRSRSFSRNVLAWSVSLECLSRSVLSVEKLSRSVRSRSFLARSVFLGVSCLECQCHDWKLIESFSTRGHSWKDTPIKDTPITDTLGKTPRMDTRVKKNPRTDTQRNFFHDRKLLERHSKQGLS